ncbi:Peptidoglycan/LPS O-acetylase OafA/YrhL, contains acyltransferase and SGNH-hydrolase domains [Tistlia consotensis]|uniref:Peptidoglycan/LPS O-acetylase OafA/YrhL, contains acyltransferase and SGNH-hydrolase domains n=1 Tax=Tistlia consotensis USBA 355 TaxID=560819 RepID=A0A1Y6C5F4_9PROT|nr:acyltransferase [Tistlia consotensis]SMF43086.1 Peptidoglycan/LPS O-acetylase OafA/YrhL, contains acyltransferase and SGNH-hydrolase domains [Tistlia consotensis USBA 355]SNR42193.1 Peptidoglycan/LPS O-acetylase OafA/YrhL, contains acyltransferase and SGNH-hydrolase domains [Tistlia consotensis]
MEGGAERRQLASLTSLRGIAALLVALYHFSGGFLPNLHLDRGSELIAKSYLWVDFFFILSGFIMMHAYGREFRDAVDWGRFRLFLAARFARVYPLHLVLLAAFVLLELGKWLLGRADLLALYSPAFSTADAKSPFALLLNLLMLQSSGLLDRLTWNGPAWSVGAEWYAYLAFPLLGLVLQRQSWRGRIGLLGAAWAGLVLLDLAGGGLDLTYDYGMLRCLFEFAFGTALYLVYERARGEPWPCGRSFAPACFAATLLLLHLGAPDLLLPPVFCLLILAVALDGAGGGRLLASRPLVFLGEISYAVYLSQLFVLQLTDMGWRAVSGQPFGASLSAGQSLLALAVLLGLLLGLSTLLHRWVETPARRALRRLGGSRRLAGGAEDALPAAGS